MQIRPVEKQDAPPVVRRIYESLEKTGSLSNLFKMLGHRPDVLRAYNQLSSAIWTEGALPLRLKELAYLRSSILNGCVY
jgi:alkylhydroperoxidase family enzyme